MCIYIYICSYVDITVTQQVRMYSFEVHAIGYFTYYVIRLLTHFTFLSVAKTQGLLVI